MLARLAVVAFSSLVVVEGACPCFHRREDNKYFVVCADRSLTSIPDCVSSEYENLVISTPTIPLVPETVQRFTNLSELVISDYSETVEMSTNILLYHQSLKFFDVRNTSIDYVDNRWLMYAPNLLGVGMINNQIATLPENTYRLLSKLLYVRLEGNQLTTLPATIFEGTSLIEVRLEGNPWHCDCELTKVLQWLRDHNVTLQDEPLCWQPLELRGLKLRELTEALACEH